MWGDENVMYMLLLGRRSAVLSITGALAAQAILKGGGCGGRECNVYVVTWQAFCSSITGALAAQAILKGGGVGGRECNVYVVTWQAFCSSITGALAAQVILKGAGDENVMYMLLLGRRSAAVLLGRWPLKRS